jgi:hypothetical protein
MWDNSVEGFLHDFPDEIDLEDYDSDTEKFMPAYHPVRYTNSFPFHGDIKALCVRDRW